MDWGTRLAMPFVFSPGDHQSHQAEEMNCHIWSSSPLQALTNSTVVYENLESEVSALHDDLWEQLNLDIQVKGGALSTGVGKVCSASSLVLCGQEEQSGCLSRFSHFKTRN